MPHACQGVAPPKPDDLASSISSTGRHIGVKTILDSCRPGNDLYGVGTRLGVSILTAQAPIVDVFSRDRTALLHLDVAFGDLSPVDWLEVRHMPRGGFLGQAWMPGQSGVRTGRPGRRETGAARFIHRGHGLARLWRGVPVRLGSPGARPRAPLDLGTGR